MTVSEEYSDRRSLWVNASLWLANNERPTLASSILNLGYAERHLLQLEADMRRLAGNIGLKSARDTTVMECSAHSELWMMGLYEVLRTLGELENVRFPALKELFEKVELLRMPIAKHETKKPKPGKAVVYYPTHIQHVNLGHVGWEYFDGNGVRMSLFRTPCANEFLAMTGGEPGMRPQFPVGGPLGMG